MFLFLTACRIYRNIYKIYNQSSFQYLTLSETDFVSDQVSQLIFLFFNMCTLHQFEISNFDTCSGTIEVFVGNIQLNILHPSSNY